MIGPTLVVWCRKLGCLDVEFHRAGLSERQSYLRHEVLVEGATLPLGPGRGPSPLVTYLVAWPKAPTP